MKSFHPFGINGQHHQFSHFTNSQAREVELKCLEQINTKDKSQNPNSSTLQTIILFTSSVCRNERNAQFLFVILFCVLNKPLWGVYYLLNTVLVMGLQNGINQVPPQEDFSLRQQTYK